MLAAHVNINDNFISVLEMPIDMNERIVIWQSFQLFEIHILS